MSAPAPSSSSVPDPNQEETNKRKATEPQDGAPHPKKPLPKSVAAKEGPPKRLESSSGVISILSQHSLGPTVWFRNKYITFQTDGMNPYFTSLYLSLVNVLYPNTRRLPNTMITEAQFVLVCRYLLKSRIDHVYSNVSGRRVTGRIVMPKEIFIPKALADLINGVGFFTAQGGCLKLCPKPEPQPQDAAQSLGSLVTFEILENFSLLIEACSSRNLIQSGLLSSVTSGTAWWMLSARSIDDPQQVTDGEFEDTKILSCFKEFTPADAVYCAIAQRQNTGLEEGIDISMKYTGDDIFGVPSLRSIYNIRA